MRAGEGIHQDNTGRQSRIDKILSNAAEHLFYYHDSDHPAPNTEISGLMVTGRFKGQQNTGDNAAQIPYGLAPFHHTAAYVFAENAGSNTGEAITTMARKPKS